jgi:CheY-like chemotaxis protein
MVATLAGRLLIVDSDYDTLGALAQALRKRGHQVVLASDGRTGLQRAVEIAADVVLVDEDIPALDARTFMEVLRDNPRTSTAHAFVMGRREPAQLSTIDARAETIVKPFNAEEVAARVEDTLRARREPQQEAELEGDLAQVALFDLLQMFAVNQRTGRLQVEAPELGGPPGQRQSTPPGGSGPAGGIWVRDGRVVDATWGAAVGEKALYRIVTMRSGRFIFVPHVEPNQDRIEAPTEQLLMEAVRRADEAVRLRDELPPLGAQVSVATRPPDCSAVARQVLDQLDEPRAIEELLDLISVSDLEILEAVHELVQAEALHVTDTGEQQVRLCDEEEVAALRAAALRLRRRGLDGPVRLAIIVDTFADVTRFSRALSSVREFVPASQGPSRVARGAVGALGSIRLDGTEVQLFVLPPDESMRPVWGPLLASTTTVLSLVDDLGASELLRAIDVEVVRASEGWQSPSGAVAALRKALGAEAVRASVPEQGGQPD